MSEETTFEALQAENEQLRAKVSRFNSLIDLYAQVSGLDPFVLDQAFTLAEEWSVDIYEVASDFIGTADFSESNADYEFLCAIGHLVETKINEDVFNHTGIEDLVLLDSEELWFSIYNEGKTDTQDLFTCDVYMCQRFNEALKKDPELLQKLDARTLTALKQVYGLDDFIKAIQTSHHR